MELVLEITEEMHKRLQERADRYAVEPADVAKMLLALEMSRAEKPSWIKELTSVVTRVSDAVMDVSKMEASKEEGE